MAVMVLKNGTSNFPINMTETNNREILKSLITSLGITQNQVAILLQEQTQRPVSSRTVRAWLADPELTSARTCPEWAINILTEQVNKD